MPAQPTGHLGGLFRLSIDKEMSSEFSPALYRDGFCEVCRSAKGQRNRGVTRRLSSKLDYDLAFVDQGLYFVTIVGGKLKTLLLELGLAPENFAPVCDGTPDQYFEVCAGNDVVPWVALKEEVGIKANALECPQCGQRMFMYVHKGWGKGVFAYVSRNDAQHLSQAASAAGFAGAPEVLLRPSGYVRLLQATDLRGVRMSKVGIVEAEEIDAHPVCRLVERS